MSTSSGVPGAIEPQPRTPQLASLRWALRRAALGMLILLVAVGLGAWLLYASIDPDEAAAGAPSPAETAIPAR